MKEMITQTKDAVMSKLGKKSIIYQIPVQTTLTLIPQAVTRQYTQGSNSHMSSTYRQVLES